MSKKNALADLCLEIVKNILRLKHQFRYLKVSMIQYVKTAIENGAAPDALTQALSSIAKSLKKNVPVAAKDNVDTSNNGLFRELLIRRILNDKNINQDLKKKVQEAASDINPKRSMRVMPDSNKFYQTLDSKTIRFFDMVVQQKKIILNFEEYEFNNIKQKTYSKEKTPEFEKIYNSFVARLKNASMRYDLSTIGVFTVIMDIVEQDRNKFSSHQIKVFVPSEILKLLNNAYSFINIAFMGRKIITNFFDVFLAIDFIGGDDKSLTFVLLFARLASSIYSFLEYKSIKTPLKTKTQIGIDYFSFIVKKALQSFDVYLSFYFIIGIIGYSQGLPFPFKLLGENFFDPDRYHLTDRNILIFFNLMLKFFNYDNKFYICFDLLIWILLNYTVGCVFDTKKVTGEVAETVKRVESILNTEDLPPQLNSTKDVLRHIGTETNGEIIKNKANYLIEFYDENFLDDPTLAHENQDLNDGLRAIKELRGFLQLASNPSSYQVFETIKSYPLLAQFLTITDINNGNNPSNANNRAKIGIETRGDLEYGLQSNVYIFLPLISFFVQQRFQSYWLSFFVGAIASGININYYDSDILINEGKQIVIPIVISWVVDLSSTTEFLPQFDTIKQVGKYGVWLLPVLYGIRTFLSNPNKIEVSSGLIKYASDTQDAKNIEFKNKFSRDDLTYEATKKLKEGDFKNYKRKNDNVRYQDFLDAFQYCLINPNNFNFKAFYDEGFPYGLNPIEKYTAEESKIRLAFPTGQVLFQNKEDTIKVPKTFKWNVTASINFNKKFEFEINMRIDDEIFGYFLRKNRLSFLYNEPASMGSNQFYGTPSKFFIDNYSEEGCENLDTIKHRIVSVWQKNTEDKYTNIKKPFIYFMKDNKRCKNITGDKKVELKGINGLGSQFMTNLLIMPTVDIYTYIDPRDEQVKPMTEEVRLDLLELGTYLVCNSSVVPKIEDLHENSIFQNETALKAISSIIPNPHMSNIMTDLRMLLGITIRVPENTNASLRAIACRYAPKHAHAY